MSIAIRAPTTPVRGHARQSFGGTRDWSLDLRAAVSQTRSDDIDARVSATIAPAITMIQRTGS
jgi:hypothetical protein